MTKEVNIGGKPIKLTANGATPIYYKFFFKKDLLKEFVVNDEGIELASENIPELAFIMAKQADGADMTKLTEKHYIEFLSAFNALDIPLAGKEIFSVYAADSAPLDEPKKKKHVKPKE